MSGSGALELSLRAYDLPDDRRGEDYRLRAILQPNERHQLSGELHYVGIESESRLIYAGGPLGVRWSMELPRA